MSEGVFIKAKGLHIVDMFPVTDCRERLLDERTLIIKPKDFSSCCLYSAAYPKGLILGEAVDDALVFFYSKKSKNAAGCRAGPAWQSFGDCRRCGGR